MTSQAAVELKESAIKARKNLPAAVASQMPQSVFTKAMLEQMIAAKRSDETEKAKAVPDKDVPAAGADIISTTIIYRAPTVPAVNLLGIAGIKIDLRAQTERFKEEYMKNFAMSKSHNMLVSRFAAMKYGFFGMMLSFLGVSTEELHQLQKSAREALVSQNKLLFEENEYAGEMLEIMGGSKKRIKAERTIIDEMRKQLLSQLSNCGFKEFSSPEKIVEIQKKQCSLILQKLVEEKASLEYEQLMADAGLCQYGDGKDVPQKLDKIQKYITKTRSRLESHDKKAEVLDKKSGKQDLFVCSDKVRLSKRGRNQSNGR